MKRARLSSLIVALDVDDLSAAKKLVSRINPAGRVFKVGGQLFTGSGPAAVSWIRKRGGKVFLDLKFHDIPHTVACSVRQAVRLGVFMMTLHIAGGEAMVAAAVEEVRREARRLRVRRPLLVGVTVLTSQEAGPGRILEMASDGLRWGLDGVVCSAREAGILRQNLGDDFYIVTPGIRAADAAGDDQKRTATVRDAVCSGSDFLVVGRPVVAAPDPGLAARLMVSQIRAALKQKEQRMS